MNAMLPLSIFLDPLYGMLMAAVLAIGGFIMAFQAEIKWGWLILAFGLYWIWCVAGAQNWGVPAPPFVLFPE